VALDSLLREIVEGRCLRADNPVKVNLEAPLEPILVRASPERLTQVFENLLDNAASFSSTGGRPGTTCFPPAGRITRTPSSTTRGT